MPSKKYIIGLAMLVVLTTVFTVGTKKAFAICTYDDLGNVISCADAPTDTAQPTDTTGGNPGTASQGTVYDTCMTNGGDAATCGYNQCMADGGTVTSCGGYEPAGTASQGPVYDSCMTNGGDAATCGYNQCRADGGTPTSCGGYESPGTASQGPVYTACMNNGGNIATCGLQQCMSEPGGSLTSCGGYDPSAVAALPASATTPYAVCMAFNSPDRCVGFTGDPALVGGAAFSPVRTCGSPGLAVGAYCQNSNGQYGFQPAVGSVGTAVNPVSGAQINPQTGMAVPTAAVNGANNNLNGAGNNNLNGGNGVGANGNAAYTLTTDPSAAPDATGRNGFQLTVCDGPAFLNTQAAHRIKQYDDTITITPVGWTPDPNYIPCDFNGAMIQIQHLINIAMVLGVLAAIAGFSYAGFLLISMSITGKMDDRKKALDIFKKVIIGFVVMLVSWFIVYQIIDWLVVKDSTGKSSLQYLLGNKTTN